MVFEDEDAAFRGELEQVDPPLQAGCQPGWILEGGLRVDQFRAPPLGFQAIQRLLQAIEANAVGVHADADHVGLFAADRAQRPGERGGFADHHIARIDQRGADRLDRSGRAVGQQIPVGVGLGGMVRGEEAGDLFAQRVEALGAAVDERGVAGLLKHPLYGGDQLLARLGIGVGDAAAQRDRRGVGLRLPPGQPPVDQAAHAEAARRCVHVVVNGARLPRLDDALADMVERVAGLIGGVGGSLVAHSLTG